jgi:lysyl-tRNA synthetase class 2
MTAPSPWWHKDRHLDRRHGLVIRNRIKSAIRSWFLVQGFVEVEPGCLVVSPGNETHLHAFGSDLVGTDLARRKMYLHTSPEFAMKKLVAAGESAIFCFTPAFRNRERGALHTPEFTMLEWYRADETATFTRLQGDCASLLRLAAEVSERPVWSWRGRSCDVASAAEDREDVGGVLEKLLGLEYAQWLDLTESQDRAAFAAFASARGISVASDDTWSSIFSRLIAEIEPKLGVGRPLILRGYPRSEAALARPDPLRPALAERFEAYVCGIELANGFGELTDPAAQRANLEVQMAERERIYGERYPIDEDFIAAVAAMPPAVGCALGFDRLVMLAAGALRIEDVQWTPIGALP